MLKAQLYIQQNTKRNMLDRTPEDETVHQLVW